MGLVTFSRVGPRGTPPHIDVSAIAAAMQLEPATWFAVRSVSPGDYDGIRAVLVAIANYLDRPEPLLWQPKVGGFYALSLEGAYPD